jgi:type I restriction enzyme S subunit
MSSPKIRFKGFTDDWEQRKLGEVAEIITGTTPPTKDKDNYGGTKLFVSPADIQGNRYVESTITTLTDKGFDLGRVLNPGTVLFVSIGSTIGKVAQIKDFATTNQQINAVVPYENVCENYLFSLLESRAEGIRKMAAQQAVPIINKTTFSNIEMLYPTLDEQKQIGTYFSTLDHLITLHQRKCDELKNIKKFMLQNMFV